MQFKYIFVCIGLDWSQNVRKNIIRESLRRLLFAVDKISNGRALLGVVGVTPVYHDYQVTKLKTVTFNRCLSDAVKDCAKKWRVAYLPLHLHFLTRDGQFIHPLSRYFNHDSELTCVGGMVLHEMLLKEIGMIPMDGEY